MMKLLGQNRWRSDLPIEELIDLFVELNFGQMENKAATHQFTLVALQIGYPIDAINEVISLGQAEFKRLLFELEHLHTRTSDYSFA